MATSAKHVKDASEGGKTLRYSEEELDLRRVRSGVLSTGAPKTLNPSQLLLIVGGWSQEI